MKTLARILLITMMVCFNVVTTTAYAEAQVKEVCKDKVDAKGQVVKNKEGKPIQECKKIKVHKKLEGTPVPEKK